MTDQLVVPVILCGGAGTRLWPVSREKMPKQFVPLIGTSSTFQQVLDRREGLFAPSSDKSATIYFSSPFSSSSWRSRLISDGSSPPYFSHQL
jgi:hypothetical protein